MIKAGIVGATGYAGNELVRILMQHPEVEIKTMTAHSYVGKTFEDVYKRQPSDCAPSVEPSEEPPQPASAESVIAHVTARAIIFTIFFII